MSNKITEKYFGKFDFLRKEKEILREVKIKTGFTAEKEIFRGEVYDKNKVGSMLYKGEWQKKPSVLKIQGLKPEVDEIDIISVFNAQNKNKKVRLPKLFRSSKWSKKRGYGYLLMEFIDAPMIYNSPFANQKEIESFCEFYEIYRTEAVKKPIFERSLDEHSSLVYAVQRVLHWAKIAQKKNTVTIQEIKNIEKFISLAGTHLPSIKMKFMHGHLTSSDIYKISDSEYVLMSNLFWSYRPEYYDTTFHLWNGIKSMRDTNITGKDVIRYIRKWLKEYKKIPLIKKDQDFERKFNIMMAERCLGALLVDLQNQEYKKNKKNHIKHLTIVFRDLFNYFSGKL